jgi:hypothetical protein
LTDLELHWPKGTPPPEARGTECWLPPEVMDRREPDNDKYDSWGLAQIVLLLYTHPKYSGIKWIYTEKIYDFKKQYDEESAFRPRCESGHSDLSETMLLELLLSTNPCILNRKMITQEAIDEIMTSSKLAGPMKTFIENLFVLYLRKRWTIQQAADFFSEHFPDKK